MKSPLYPPYLFKDTNMKTWLFMDASIVALTLWREASGEGTQGMKAVANVIYNRALHNGITMYDVCTAPNQFSSLSIRGDASTIRWPKQTDVVFQSACQLAEDALAGTLEDITDGALFYYNPKTATSGWFVQSIVNNPTEHPQTVQLGNHVFFK